MNIVSQNYNNLLKNIFFEAFSSNLNKLFNKSFNSSNNVFNYINIISNLDDSLCNIAKQSLIDCFESIDNEFKHSLVRKRKYEVKSYHPRSILTIFGEITYYRTFFKSKINGNSYCYVDRFLGLKKYDYFDPYLKSIVIEYSSNNSYSKVAKHLNDLIGNRVSIENKHKYFSRQSIRNIILKSNLSINKYEQKDYTPDTLYIIADEKWIPTQNNNKNKIMEKSVVIFEGIKNHKIINKKIFASNDKSFLDDSIDYIYNSYDIDKIKNIFVMGDGAKWIYNLKYEYKISPHINVTFCLDKFHFKQSIHHIALNRNLEDILTYYVLNNMKNDFKECCLALIQSYPHRKDTIKQKLDYVLNNWNNINNLYINHLSCPMESQISHNIADLFTSRPKAYSVKMINKLMKIRLHYKNNDNIKELYLNNYNSITTLTINNEFLNFNIFNNYHTNYLNNKIYNPTF